MLKYLSGFRDQQKEGLAGARQLLLYFALLKIYDTVGTVLLFSSDPSVSMAQMIQYKDVHLYICVHGSNDTAQNFKDVQYKSLEDDTHWFSSSYVILDFVTQLC